MSNIVYIATHEDDAVARLASQFRQKPLIEGLIRAFVAQHQGMEDANDELLTERLIDTAVGAQLDGFGSIVGELRQGRADDEYRLALKARMGRNNSEGTPEDVINVFNLLTGSTQTQLLEASPAVITLTGNVDFSANAVAIKAFMQRVVAAGVRIDWIASQAPGPVFGFLGVPGASGFDDSLNLGTGGTFVSAF